MAQATRNPLAIPLLVFLAIVVTALVGCFRRDAVEAPAFTAGLVAVSQPQPQDQHGFVDPGDDAFDGGVVPMASIKYNPWGGGRRPSKKRWEYGNPAPWQRRETRMKQGEAAYEYPSVPRANAGVIPQTIDTKVGKCERNYAKCHSICTRYTARTMIYKSRECYADCYRRRRHCFWGARPAHLKVRPEFREQMGLTSKQTFDEWVDSQYSTRPEWKVTDTPYDWERTDKKFKPPPQLGTYPKPDYYET